MKLAEFQQYLRKEKISVAFFSHPDPAITYFTQTIPSHAILTISPKITKLYLTSLDKKPKTKQFTVKNFTPNTKKELKNSKAKKVGINKTTMTVSQYENLKKYYPNAKFVDISKTIQQLRSSKTAKEKKCIAKACQITSNAFNELLKELQKKTLKTEQDVAEFVEKHFKKENAVAAFPTIAAMGKNAATPHHVTSNQPLTRGFLLIDFGAKYKNYCADMTRMIFLGTPTEKEQGWYDFLLEAQQASIAKVAENIPYADLDKTARTKLGKHQKYFTHSLGHGIGIEVHEDPTFSSDSKIQRDVPFTIEPGLYFPGKFGLRIEDTLIYNGKTTIFTTAPKELPHIKGF